MSKVQRERTFLDFAGLRPKSGTGIMLVQGAGGDVRAARPGNHWQLNLQYWCEPAVARIVLCEI